jgi:Protein of unknown function (DUF998)
MVTEAGVRLGDVGRPRRASDPGAGPAYGRDSAAVTVRHGVRSIRIGPVGVVLGAIGLAVLAMLVLHLIAAGRLDPATTTVSDYVSVPGGSVLLAFSTLAIAVATAAVPVGLVRARIPGAAGLCLPFGLGSAGLLASIAFPTNALGAAVSVDTVVHRYAAGVFFVSLPVAALLTLRRLPDRAVAWLTGLGVVAGVLFLASHAPLVFPDWSGARLVATLLPRGLAERGLLLVDLAVLAVLAMAGRRALR